MNILRRSRGVSLTTALLVILCTVCSIHSQNTSPPAILQQPQPSRGQELYIMDKRVALELECSATGTPPPTYKWVKFDVDGNNREELSESDPRVTVTDGNLRVGNQASGAVTGLAVQEIVTTDDEGIYQCIAENKFGSALSQKITAKIAFMGSFDATEAQSITAREGEKVVLECNPPKGVPPSHLSIYWTYGNPGAAVIQPVKYDDRVLKDAMGNLVFSNVMGKDSYDYVCNAPNNYIGEVKTSSIFMLNVNTNNPVPARGPTWVYKPPISKDFLRTKTMSLKCIAEGNPTPSITWSWDDSIDIDGRIALGPEGAELEVRDLTFDDAGSYTCTATNGESAPITYTSTVTVRSAPYWDPNPPQDTTIAPKESVTITCQAGGSPGAQVSWLINGKPESEVEPNPRRQITSGLGSGQIIVTNAEQSDSAVFQCVAKNVHGEEITSVFLNVLAIPAELRQRPKPQYEVAEGATVEMKCKPFGKPNPTVTWTFKGQQINAGGRGDSDRHTIETGGTNEGMLTISDLTLEDAGTYNCNVTNDFGTEDASPRLIVRMKTTVIEGPGDLEVEKDANAVLKCDIQSDSELELTVIWSHDGEEIDTEVDNGRYRQNSDNSLTIIMVKRTDGGDYTCRAVTTFSEDMATGSLTVLSVPDPPINVEVIDSDEWDATIQWTPGNDGNSEVIEYIIYYQTEFQELGWMEIAKVGAADTDETVTLKPYNTYQFHVKARNSVGTSMQSESSDSHTTPQREPSVNPEGVTGSGPEPGLMVVDWERVHPVDYAGPNFKYIVRYRVKGESDWTEAEVNADKNQYRVTSDVTFQEYEVQVITQNDAGRSTETPDTTVGFSGESEPTAAPGDVEVEVLDAENIRVTFTAVPPESINGQSLGYRVYYTIVIAANSESFEECKYSPCVVSGLKPYSDYSLQVAVYNGAGEGPKSEPTTFSTPQGAPSVVLDFMLTPSSDRILADWKKPERHNGILSGYLLTHSIMLGNELINTTKIEIKDADTTRTVIPKVNADTKYSINVVAKTSGGSSKEAFAETRTRPRGAPMEPGAPVFKQVGTDSMNITFALPTKGAAADHIAVKYHKKDENVDQAKTTDFVDIFEDKMVFIDDLQPKTKYVVQLIAKNSQGEVAGKWAETETSGTGAAKGGGFKVEGWFVALIVIIIILLLILLIICVLKSQKGGKYNVSDKEQQLKGDIESTPLKDEGGFEEFQPRDGNMDEGAPLTSGSHPSLQESDPGSSETDSLKEYADGDTGKFNEEGSFIGQYGDRKTRPPDDSQEGGAAYSTFV